jgi:hypothetical protein
MLTEKGQNKCKYPLLILEDTGSTIYELCLFFGLMILAKGWYITRVNLESQEKKATICM